MASRRGVQKFVQWLQVTGSIHRKHVSGRPSKLTVEVRKLFDDFMEEDDEKTAHQIHHELLDRGYNLFLKPFFVSEDKNNDILYKTCICNTRLSNLRAS